MLHCLIILISWICSPCINLCKFVMSNLKAQFLLIEIFHRSTEFERRFFIHNQRIYIYTQKNKNITLNTPGLS